MGRLKKQLKKLSSVGGKLNVIRDEKPVFMYVSNSLKRAVCLGTLSGNYLTIYLFSDVCTRDRCSELHSFPHQVHTHAFGRNVEVHGTRETNSVNE
jgi:hypothetical protein